MPAGCEIGVLVGRDREFSRLQELLDLLVRGLGQVALIEGEAGAGKSRLLAELLAKADERGVAIMFGAAEEWEHDRPLGALGRALALDREPLDPERHRIRQLLAGDEAGNQNVSLNGSSVLRFRLMDAVGSLLEELTQQRPTLLAVEDLQWADALTVLSLHHLLRRLRHRPLAVVGTLRPVPRSEELEQVVDDVAATAGDHILLPPLDEAAVRALVTAYVGSDPGPALLAYVGRAGGNPFYVTELLRSLGEDGAIEIEEQTEASPRIAPPTLRATILRRVGSLSGDTQSVVRVASLLGSSFSVSALAAVFGRLPLDLVSALDEAIAAGVLGEQGDTLAFRHDVLREAVYEAIPLPLRKGLHLQAGRALAVAGAAPTEVAPHFAAGAGPGDVVAVDWIVRAARRIGPFAPARSAELLRRAVEITPSSDPARRDALLVERVWSLVWARKFVDVRLVASEVLRRTTDPAVSGMLRCALAKALLAEGRMAESLHELEAGLGERGLPDAMRVRLLADVASRRLHCRDLTGGRAAAEEALAASERLASAATACAALTSLSFLASLEGRLAEAEELAGRAIAIADRDATGEAAQARPWLLAAYQRIQADRLEEVDAIVHRGREADHAGAVSAAYHALAALARYQEGRWYDAVDEAEMSLALSEETGARPLSLVAYAVLAHIAVHRGDPAAARSALDAAEAELQITGPARFGLPWLMWARALVQAEEHPSGALALLEGTWTLLQRLGTPAECYELAPDLVRLALARDRRDLASSVTARVEELATCMATGTVKATARLCRGLLDSDASVLCDAVVALRLSPRVLQRAQGSEAAGRALRIQGDAEAVSYLEEALESYERLGAAHDAARVEAELRGAGIRRGRRGRRTRPSSGWESLTPTEAAVVRLTVEGLTNRAIGQQLFISHRTVATHLSHVFGKLGLSTRVELIAQASRRQDR